MHCRALTDTVMHQVPDRATHDGETLDSAIVSKSLVSRLRISQSAINHADSDCPIPREIQPTLD